MAARDTRRRLAVWLAGVDANDPALLEFAWRIDDACKEAARVSGRELPPRLAAAVVLRVAAANAEPD